MLEQQEHEISFCSQDGFFANESGNISPNPANLTDGRSQIDSESVFSMLQFGAIIPPLSPWWGIRRLMPGHTYRGAEVVGWLPGDHPKDVSNMSPDQQADEIEAVLDAVLRRELEGRIQPVVLLSGGVDSGIIACWLAALECRDPLLITIGFGDEDPESSHAEAVAKSLRKRRVRVSTTGRTSAAWRNQEESSLNLSAVRRSSWLWISRTS